MSMLFITALPNRAAFCSVSFLANSISLMASQPCWRCLQRLTLSPLHSQRPLIPRNASAAFSTSTQLSVKKAPPTGRKDPNRGKKTLKLGKKKVVRAKPPAIGERKAVRKRIVLSNTNALDVEGLRDWNKTNYADPRLEGTMAGLPGPLVDSLRAVEAFQTSQGWGFFKRPATLIRKETTTIARHVQDCTQAEKPETMRRLLVGERGSGKSILLLQAQAIAFQAGWVVIHIPAAQILTNANTDYAPLADTVPTKYIQPTYTSDLLSRIVAANEPVLSSLKLTQKHDLPIPVQPNLALSRFADLGAQDPSIAWPIFTALWRELTAPNQGRPPILFTLDGIAHISRLTHYLEPSMHNIDAHDLALVDHFAAHLSGEQSLPNGGAILAADSGANRPIVPSLDLAIRQSEAATPTGATALPLRDDLHPFVPQDERVLQRWRRVEVLRVPALSRDETKVVLEYFAKSGLLRSMVNEALVTEKWTISGGGLYGQLEKVALRDMV